MTNAVLDFRPSRHGLHFANEFLPGPTVRLGLIDTRWFGFGDAAAGLCGGMAFTVRDMFEAGVDPPLDTEPPLNGSPRFRSLVRRQVQSLDWLRVPLRFYNLAAFRPAAMTMWSRVSRRKPLPDVTLDDEWPKVRADIDAGRLAIVGLVRTQSWNPLRLATNHQVVAYAYHVDPQRISIRVYDPNWPGRDDVEARIMLEEGRPVRLESSTAEPLLGFFRTAYSFVEPRSWRA